ncbi:MAG: hypothetical protein HRT88_11630 [Lentisphaeraceae bacterium]|nr:hypothetical protein [Lentisphaeraceae bacterium]
MTHLDITKEINTEILCVIAVKEQLDEFARVNSRKNKSSKIFSIVVAGVASILLKQNVSGTVMLAFGGMISISKGIEYTMNFETKSKDAHRAARKCEKVIVKYKNVRSHVGVWTEKQVLKELNLAREYFAEIQEDFPIINNTSKNEGKNVRDTDAVLG